MASERFQHPPGCRQKSWVSSWDEVTGKGWLGSGRDALAWLGRAGAETALGMDGVGGGGDRGIVLRGSPAYMAGFRAKSQAGAAGACACAAGAFPAPRTRALRGQLLRGSGVSRVRTKGGRGRLLGARVSGVDSSLLSSLRG